MRVRHNGNERVEDTREGYDKNTGGEARSYSDALLWPHLTHANPENAYLEIHYMWDSIPRNSLPVKWMEINGIINLLPCGCENHLERNIIAKQ